MLKKKIQNKFWENRYDKPREIFMLNLEIGHYSLSSIKLIHKYTQTRKYFCFRKVNYVGEKESLMNIYSMSF